MEIGNNYSDLHQDYVYVEYPKWVTLADGSQIIVNSDHEEQVVVGTEPTETTNVAQPVKPKRGRPAKS